MKRSREDIIESILETCKEPATKTRIVYKNNLNFHLADRYLSLLVNLGALEASEAPHITYKTTPKGIELMEHIKASNVHLGEIRNSTETLIYPKDIR